MSRVGMSSVSLPKVENDELREHIKELGKENYKLRQEILKLKNNNISIPSQVLIGGFKYKVEYEKNLARDRNCTGQSCGNLQTISLDAGLNNQLRETTFIHEVIEQFNFCYDIALNHHQICLLEAAIYAYLKNNKGV